MSKPCIYICIPVFNRIEYTLACIASIGRQSYTNYRIIVCDDGSTDGTSELLGEKHPEVEVLQGTGDLWWAGGTNMCVSRALELAGEDDFIYTLNNDTELLTDTLEESIALAGQFPGSITGSLNVFYEDHDRIEPSAFKRKKSLLFSLYPHRVHSLGDPIPPAATYLEVDAFAGKGVLIPAEIFRSIGIYNADMLPHYHADSEFTLRARRAGYRLYYNYRSKVLSHQYLTGTGTMSRSFREFLRSFGNIKSAIHYRSVRNYSKLVYGRRYLPYFWLQLARITLGYFKRFFKKDYSSGETPAL